MNANTLKGAKLRKAVAEAIGWKVYREDMGNGKLGAWICEDPTGLPHSLTLQLSRAVRRRLELRVGRLVPKREKVGVLQKRSCAALLLCYSNHIDNATGETK